MHRNICDIARDIINDWSQIGEGINYSAKPYLDAMLQLSGPNDMYFADDAKTVVIYFLSNATSYRGERAKGYKKELKSIFNLK